MSQQFEKRDIKAEIQQMRAFSKMLSRDKEKAHKFFCETGIYDENWNLTDWYK